jgi:hypothetical protein
VKESSQHVEESSQHVEESSQYLELLLAVLSVFRADGFGCLAVLEESLHVVFPSVAVASGSQDGMCESKS